MSRPGAKMLVESDPWETRIAVLEQDRLTELYLERHHHRGFVGNVYKGRVSRVLPGMQAAFVDIGLERDAFLHIISDHAEIGAKICYRLVSVFVERLRLTNDQTREAIRWGLEAIGYAPAASRALFDRKST